MTLTLVMAVGATAGLLAGCSEDGGDPAFEAEVEAENANTLNLITGTYIGTLNRMAGEMGAVLDDDDLRVISMTGRGSLQGIRDLLYLEGVDIAMFASFVVEYGRRNNLHPGVDLDAIEYIAPLFPQYLHVLAGDDIQSIQDLEGRRVNLGPSDRDLTFILSTLILNDLGIQVEVVTESHTAAVGMVESGAIDAMFRIGGLPQSVFEDLDETSGVHFVPIAQEDLGTGSFSSLGIPADAYPALIEAGTEVPAVSSRTILAVYNPTGTHARGALVDRFVNRLFDNLSTLQEPEEYHPAWQNVDLNEEIPGMPRYAAAQARVTP